MTTCARASSRLSQYDDSGGQAGRERELQRNLKMLEGSEAAASLALTISEGVAPISDLFLACDQVLHRVVQSGITGDSQSTMREDTLDNRRGERGIVQGNNGE